jgi:hypothetical protein
MDGNFLLKVSGVALLSSFLSFTAYLFYPNSSPNKRERYKRLPNALAIQTLREL